jgi:hypothetical protein
LLQRSQPDFLRDNEIVRHGGRKYARTDGRRDVTRNRKIRKRQGKRRQIVPRDRKWQGNWKIQVLSKDVTRNWKVGKRQGNWKIQVLSRDVARNWKVGERQGNWKIRNLPSGGGKVWVRGKGRVEGREIL